MNICRAMLAVTIMSACALSASAKDAPPVDLPLTPALQNGLRAAPTPPPGVSYVTVSGNNGTATAIPDSGSVSTQITLSGAAAVLWDLDANLNITHTFTSDLSITLTSPAGTVVTLSSNNGGDADNVFAGTLFDDQGGAPVTDFVFTDLVAATPLAPEEPLDAFRGENPNGIWTLTVTDDAAIDIGTINSWSLTANTLAAAPAQATQTFADTPNLVIADVATVSDTITVSGLPTHLTELSLLTGITHTFPSDLEVTLTSPAGTVVTVTTDNGGGGKFNVRGVVGDTFNGTNWFNNAQDPVTDHEFIDSSLVTPLSPEESFAAFAGEDPNGVWTLTITDDEAGDVGNLANWSLNISGAALVTGAGSTPVPTLRTWSLLAMSGLLLAIGMFWRRRARS